MPNYTGKKTGKAKMKKGIAVAKAMMDEKKKMVKKKKKKSMKKK